LQKKNQNKPKPKYLKPLSFTKHKQQEEKVIKIVTNFTCHYWKYYGHTTPPTRPTTYFTSELQLFYTNNTLGWGRENVGPQSWIYVFTHWFFLEVNNGP